MTIQQCKYVLEVAKLGSFNEASKQLFIAQPSLSNSIKTLETELGIKIFVRSNNGAYLTDDGSEFVRYASQLVERNDFILNRYNGNDTGKKLSVATQHYDFIADIFCDLIRETKYPSFYFSLREMKTFDIIKEVETANCDLGIIAIKDNDYEPLYRYISGKNIEFFEFVKAKPHVFIRKGHPLLCNAVIRTENLKDYPFVSYEQGSHTSSFFTEETVSNAKSIKHIEISDRATLMNVLLTTDSYTVGTGIMPSVLNDKKIVSVPYEMDEIYHIGYIILKDRIKSDLTQNFISKLFNFADRLKP